jgi:hypothetical protein
MTGASTLTSGKADPTRPPGFQITTRQNGFGWPRGPPTRRKSHCIDTRFFGRALSTKDDHGLKFLSLYLLNVTKPRGAVGAVMNAVDTLRTEWAKVKPVWGSMLALSVVVAVATGTVILWVDHDEIEAAKENAGLYEKCLRTGMMAPKCAALIGDGQVAPKPKSSEAPTPPAPTEGTAVPAVAPQVLANDTDRKAELKTTHRRLPHGQPTPQGPSAPSSTTTINGNCNDNKVEGHGNTQQNEC